MGNEWTKLDKSQKKFYLDKAEIDKKRYREELRIYRKSDAYQTYLRWKRAKSIFYSFYFFLICLLFRRYFFHFFSLGRQTNGTEESDIDATDEIEVN